MTHQLARLRALSRTGLALAATCCMAWAQQAAAAAQPVSAPLTYFKNYFLTGDYVATSVALAAHGKSVTIPGLGTNSYATGQLNVPGIPQNAEIVAAYLYWETVYPSPGAGGPTAPGSTPASHIFFNSNDISANAILLTPNGVPTCTPTLPPVQPPPGNPPPVLNTNLATYVYRADVLPYIPRYAPSNPTQPIQVAAQGNHTVVLPDAGGKTPAPTSLGASLIIVWTLPGYNGGNFTQANAPLKSIVIYNGGAELGAGAGANTPAPQLMQHVEGFYEALRTQPQAKLSFIQGNSSNQLNELVQFSDTYSNVPPAAPVPAKYQQVQGAWGGGGNGFDNPTWNLQLDPGAMKTDLIFSSTRNGPNNTVQACGCVTLGAIVMSTLVQDRDGDGLLDVWESQNEWSSKPLALRAAYPSWPLADPNGRPLPNLQAMGSNPDVQDIFVQIDYLNAADHTHLPALSALENVAQAFYNAAPRPSLSQLPSANCPMTAAPGKCPIMVHFDVGNNYQNLWTQANCANSWNPDCSIIQLSAGPANAGPLAVGSPIAEQLCQANGTLASDNKTACAFPGYPGAVGWKNGMLTVRDELVDAADHTQPCTSALQSQPGGCEPRLPRTRKDMFHYVLFAHALGYPTSATSGTNMQVPRTNSGVADAPGGDVMVTLGLWGDPSGNGSAFVQGSTLMHELGHNLGLRHGGWLQNGTVIEPNCKPNYQSVMNYLFQIQGLFDANGNLTIDYSRQQLRTLNPSNLSEQSGMTDQSNKPPLYEMSWYAPLATAQQGNPLLIASPRHCDGTPDSPADPAYARLLQYTQPNGALDWSGEGKIGQNDHNELINYIPGTTGQFTGVNDFSTMDLRQVGSRRTVGSKQLSYSVVDPLTGEVPQPPAPAVGGGLSLDTTAYDVLLGNVGYGDLGYGDLGYGDLGYGDLGYGDLGYGDLGYGDLGYGDLGYGDLGYGDLGAPAENSPGAQGDVTFEAATAVPGVVTSLNGSIGYGPYEYFDVNLSWNPPNVGTVDFYTIYETPNATFNPTMLSNYYSFTVPGGQTTAVDDSSNANNIYNQPLTYVIVAHYLPSPGSCPSGSESCVDTVSAPSAPITVTYPTGEGE